MFSHTVAIYTFVISFFVSKRVYRGAVAKECSSVSNALSTEALSNPLVITTRGWKEAVTGGAERCQEDTCFFVGAPWTFFFLVCILLPGVVVYYVL